VNSVASPSPEITKEAVSSPQSRTVITSERRLRLVLVTLSGYGLTMTKLGKPSA